MAHRVPRLEAVEQEEGPSRKRARIEEENRPIQHKCNVCNQDFPTLAKLRGHSRSQAHLQKLISDC